MNDLFAIPVLAFLASLVLTPLVRRAAESLGIVDKPDAHRKIHDRAVPLCGGVAVYLALVASIGAALLLPNALSPALLANRTPVIGLAIAAFLLCVVGVIDDWRQLRGTQKMLGQSIAVVILILAGFTIERISLFGWQIELGIFSFPFTFLWLLGAINALNLIDGVDGLATTVGIILCGTLTVMAFLNGHSVESVLALAMVGALVGFLYFNFPPATIFLGDAGSMLIGLTAGTLAIRSSLKGPATVALAAPLAVWAIPFFDTAVAIVRRKLTGRSIYATDRGHLHHCVLRRSSSSWRAVSWIAALCMVTSAGALATVYWNNELFAIVSVLGVVGVLVATGVFGHAEFMLLTSHLRVPLASILQARSRGDRGIRVQLQGCRNWDLVFEQLRGAAELLGFLRVRLDLNLPALHEGYHAAWQNKDASLGDDCWRVVLPLTMAGKTIGRLELAGRREEGAEIEGWLAQIAELLDAVEARIAELMLEPPTPVPSRLAAQPLSDPQLSTVKVAAGGPDDSGVHPVA